MHTNSFTSDRLPQYGVETPHEHQLGQVLNSVDTWGIDIFKIETLSNNRPLTCVAFAIFQVFIQMLISISVLRMLSFTGKGHIEHSYDTIQSFSSVYDNLRGSLC